MFKKKYINSETYIKVEKDDIDIILKYKDKWLLKVLSPISTINIGKNTNFICIRDNVIHGYFNTPEPYKHFYKCLRKKFKRMLAK